MTVVQTARQRARQELELVIKQTAARHLAESGAAALSLRAVAREMGMASSALYRYYASRDALLTALIVDAYDGLGQTAETADVQALQRQDDPGQRWLAVCRAVRQWALGHPHEWALVYGSPVPGYAAPSETVGPATRLSRVMAGVVLAAVDDGSLRPSQRRLPSLATDAVAEIAGGRPAAPYDDVLERSVVLVVGLVGTVSYELFGHTVGAFTDDGAWFDAAMAVVAEGVGLDLPV